MLFFVSNVCVFNVYEAKSFGHNGASDKRKDRCSNVLCLHMSTLNAVS